VVGYMRVSKTDGSQTVELQRDALLDAGVDAAHLYDDHASGRRDDRHGLASCLKALRDGDTLVVWKLDRLGRNLPRRHGESAPRRHGTGTSRRCARSPRSRDAGPG